MMYLHCQQSSPCIWILVLIGLITQLPTSDSAWIPSQQKWRTSSVSGGQYLFRHRPRIEDEIQPTGLVRSSSSSSSSGGGGDQQPTTSSVVAPTAAILGDRLTAAVKACGGDVTKVCQVQVQPVATDRLGLVATQDIQAGEVLLALPYDDRFVLTAQLARKTVFKGYLPEAYDSWTGDTGLIALLLLNEVARAAGSHGLAEPSRPPALAAMMQAWVAALPRPAELNHPLWWSEGDQEILQSSSTKKIYRLLDDLDEDGAWLETNLFAPNRDMFPAEVVLNGETLPCFSLTGFRWAMALAQSRSFFVGGQLRLIPFLDMCNHADHANEVDERSMGTFGTTRGAQLVAARPYAAGQEVFASYGPKSAADYLLEHGFCPDAAWKTAVSELTFELDATDRFYDDKLDILEVETYVQAPMDPVQTFDVVSAPGRDGQPDPALIQFVRLCKLGGTDAFLLESIFRKDVWGFMQLPVSETNELDVVNTISEACRRALEDLEACPPGGPPVCARLRQSESQALRRTMEYLQREREALDLKEYYQERRLKSLGLDSEWSPEDDMEADLSYGQTRAPGGADYDW